MICAVRRVWSGFPHGEDFAGRRFKMRCSGVPSQGRALLFANKQIAIPVVNLYYSDRSIITIRACENRIAQMRSRRMIVKSRVARDGMM